MATKIDTPDMAFSSQIVTLNKVSYIFKFRYSSRFDRWTLSIYNRKGVVILEGERLVPKQELLYTNGKSDLMQGYLVLESLSEVPVTRNNLGLGKEHFLAFYPY